jgi:hypothetical protein
MAPSRTLGGLFGLPRVTARTWSSSIMASCGTSDLMQLKVASTGPLPSHSSSKVRPSMSSLIVARCGPRVPAMTDSETSFTRSRA